MRKKENLKYFGTKGILTSQIPRLCFFSTCYKSSQDQGKLSCTLTHGQGQAHASPTLRAHQPQGPARASSREESSMNDQDMRPPPAWEEAINAIACLAKVQDVGGLRQALQAADALEIFNKAWNAL